MDPRDERLISGAFAFLLISLFPIAGRAQYFLQPEFQRVRAGAGDHPEGHHRHGPRPVLQQLPAADGAAVLAGTGLEQPLAQVRSTATRPRGGGRSWSRGGFIKEGLPERNLDRGQALMSQRGDFFHVTEKTLWSPAGTV